ncbi:MAG: SH3 domain-containing protein [Burkholderiaceae bacterium]
MTASQGMIFRSIAFVFLMIVLLPAAHAQEMVSVDRNEINMRTGPGTEHKSIWMLSRGYPLMVIGRKGDWLNVRDFESDEGWVFGPMTARKPHMVVKSQGPVNLRSGPGTNTKVIGSVRRGDVLRTIEQRQGWARVETQSGTRGWVSRGLLWGY